MANKHNKRAVEGEKLAGYSVVHEIGRGAGSDIYLVKDPADEAHYALKQVIRTGAEADRFIDQLEQEFKVSSAVSHPAIRRCLEIKRKRVLFREREVYLVMEYIRGTPMHEFKFKNVKQMVKAFIGTAEGLAAMNAAGYVHADIKPNNIIISESGTVRLIDLGQSCEVGTIKERIQGTPDYIAPEQVRRKPLTPQTDMYNFGATMYWVLTGKNIPTLIPKTDDLGNKIENTEKFYPPRRLNPKVPYLLDKIVGDCLRSRPSYRPDSWELVIDKLKMTVAQMNAAQELRREKQEVEIKIDPTIRRRYSRSGEMLGA